MHEWLRAFRSAGDGTTTPDMPGIRQLRVLIWPQTQRLTGYYGGHPPGDFRLSPNPDTRTIRLVERQPTSGNAKIEVRSEDFLDVARELHEQGLRVAVLNMASAHRAGGGVESGAGAQEENHHRRSNAWRALAAQQLHHYPVPRDACLLSKEVTIFRGPETAGYPLETPFRVDVITSAAPAHPPLDRRRRYARRRDEEDMQTQVALILEAAHISDCQALVLSAFGCGAYGNPPLGCGQTL